MPEFRPNITMHRIEEFLPVDSFAVPIWVTENLAWAMREVGHLMPSQISEQTTDLVRHFAGLRGCLVEYPEADLLRYHLARSTASHPVPLLLCSYLGSILFGVQSDAIPES